NPYFELNSALLSRTQIFELEPLSEDELREVIARGAAALGVSLAADVTALVARRGGGDARSALSILELAVQTAGGAPTEEQVEDVGLPEARLNLAQAAIYLAKAPKSNASYRAIGAATADVREHGHLRPPDAVRSAKYAGAKKLGRGEGYVNPHDDPAGFDVDN